MTREAGLIAHLDCSTGVSGDKLLGALLDVGEQTGAFTADRLQTLASALAPEANVTVRRTVSHGVSGVGLAVSAAHEPHSRTWATVRDLIAAAPLTVRARELALAAFAALADAEAAAHGCAPDEVHFHEVGALDSLVDIVGACAAFDALDIECLVATPLAIGSGEVSTSHGMLAVPAPATARLLVGLPTTAGRHASELTTPTGAALVRTLASDFAPLPAATPVAIGFGCGTREIGEPNVCRLILATPTVTAPELSQEAVVLLETNVDHLSGEAIGFALDQLLAEGALDAWAAPITMKKNRPAYLLSVLGYEQQANDLAARVVALTGTLGVRTTTLDRLVAQRQHVSVDTPYGPVRVKVGPAGSAQRVRPEADEVARIARTTGRSYGAVHDELVELAHGSLGV